MGAASSQNIEPDYKARSNRAAKRVNLAKKALGHAKKEMDAAKEKLAAAEALAKKFPTPENLAKLADAKKIVKRAKKTLKSVGNKVEKYRQQERKAKEMQT